MENHNGPKPLLSIVKKLSPQLETSTIFHGDAQKQIHSEDMTLRLINRIFEKFEKRYESMYYKTYKTQDDVIAAKKNWASEISQIPMRKLKRGMETVFERCPDWPPTLNQFIHACHAVGTPTAENSEIYKPLRPLLEKSTVSERQAHARIGLQVARNILGGNGGAEK